MELSLMIAKQRAIHELAQYFTHAHTCDMEFSYMPKFYCPSFYVNQPETPVSS